LVYSKSISKKGVELLNESIKSRSISIDYLRGFLTILVVLHHSLLGYTSQGTASLIVDSNKFSFFDYIVSLQDSYFMFLFFFISGLFTLENINKNGSIDFIKKRLIRLGIPFIIGWLIINMPAYYLSVKAYVVFILNSDISISRFFQYWIDTQKMATAGPLWFIWVLLLFNIIVVFIISVIKKINNKIIHKYKIRAFSIPYFLVTFFIAGFILYTLFATLNENRFYNFLGPFEAQVNRLPLYFLFYIMGVILSRDSLSEGIFSKSSLLVKYWWITGLVGLSFWRVLYIPALYNNGLFPFFALTSSFVLAALFLSITLMGIFRSYFSNEITVFNSLSSNAYGIYILHYTFVALFQYLFLFTDFPGFLKGFLVFMLSVLSSWGVSFLIRKIVIVRKVIG
jgi:fucose 4-O-acetylase-like acetyltransferase